MSAKDRLSEMLNAFRRIANRRKYQSLDGEQYRPTRLRYVERPVDSMAQGISSQKKEGKRGPTTDPDDKQHLSNGYVRPLNSTELRILQEFNKHGAADIFFQGQQEGATKLALQAAREKFFTGMPSQKDEKTGPTPKIEGEKDLPRPLNSTELRTLEEFNKHGAADLFFQGQQEGAAKHALQAAREKFSAGMPLPTDQIDAVKHLVAREFPRPVVERGEWRPLREIKDTGLNKGLLDNPVTYERLTRLQLDTMRDAGMTGVYINPSMNLQDAKVGFISAKVAGLTVQGFSPKQLPSAQQVDLQQELDNKLAEHCPYMSERMLEKLYQVKPLDSVNVGSITNGMVVKADEAGNAWVRPPSDSTIPKLVKVPPELAQELNLSVKRRVSPSDQAAMKAKIEQQGKAAKQTMGSNSTGGRIK